MAETGSHARDYDGRVPMLFFDATRDSRTGTIYLKLVNRGGTPQPVRVEIGGMIGVEPKGQMIAMSASSPEDTNSITAPRKIVPVTSDIDGLGATFTRSLPA
jgi:alpha-N-arabinofuranosidase